MSQESLTQKEAARRLEVSTTWVRELTGRGVLSRNADASYPWPKIREEHDAFQRESEAERSGGFSDRDYQEQRARLTRLKADAAETENRVRRGELVESADVEAMVRASLERANAVLKQVPAKYGPKLARRTKLRLPEAKSVLSDIVEAVRAELRKAPGGDGVAAA